MEGKFTCVGQYLGYFLEQRNIPGMVWAGARMLRTSRQSLGRPPWQLLQRQLVLVVAVLAWFGPQPKITQSIQSR